MLRLVSVPLLLLGSMACETPVPTGGTGCEVEIDTRVEVTDEVAVVEVWVTNFYEDRTLSIPDCVGVVIDGSPALTCGPDGEIDLSGCQPATFDLRADTSLQIATVRRRIDGDACNEPLEPGIYEVTAIGIETFDYRTCRRVDGIAVADNE